MVVIAPVIFFLLGLIMGSVARGRGAFGIVAMPVILGIVDILTEGPDAPSIVAMVISIVVCVAGVLVGQRLVQPRLEKRGV